MCLVSKEIMTSTSKYSLDLNFSPLYWLLCDVKTKNSDFRGVAAQRACVWIFFGSGETSREVSLLLLALREWLEHFTLRWLDIFLNSLFKKYKWTNFLPLRRGRSIVVYCEMLSFVVEDILCIFPFYWTFL